MTTQALRPTEFARPAPPDAGEFGALLDCRKNRTGVGLSCRSMEPMAEKTLPAVNAAIGNRVAAV